jgi:hypothetical protein
MACTPSLMREDAVEGPAVPPMMSVATPGDIDNAILAPTSNHECSECDSIHAFFK